MKEYSILVPFKSDNGHRERCFDWLMAYYETICPEAEIIVGTSDECNRSRMRNDAASRATTDIFVFIDADGLVRKETIRAAVENVKMGYPLAQPSKVSFISRAATERIVSGDFQVPAIGRRDVEKTENLIGEFFAVSRSTFKKVRGWDENFTGWGGEDDAFKCAIRALIGPFKIMPDTVYHLWHERSANESNKHERWKEQKARADMYIAARTNPRLMRQILGISHTDTKEFSILIPFQRGDAHREKIFDWLVRFYRLNVPEAEIVIGEDYTGKINRSRMRNDAFNKSTRDILVYIDADGLIRPEDIREAVKRVRDGSAMVQAETVTWITKESTAAILDGPTDWPSIEKKDIQAVERVLGEFFVLSRETFEKVRGWDERFEGWGGEDQAFRCAVMALVGKIEKLPSTVYHLWHPRTVNECPKHSGFKANKVLRDRYVSYQGNSRAMESLISERFANARVAVDFYAQATQYFDHLESIWNAMPVNLKGKFYVHSSIGNHVRSKKVRAYIMPSRLKVVQNLRKGMGPVVVAGIEDAKTVYAAGRIPFLVDHGVGQTYIDSNNGSYARGNGRDFMGLFIVPNEWCERENLKGCPDVPTAIVGCPKLDPWHNRPAKKRSNPPVVCVSFHWDCSISVETRGAFDYFKGILPELAKSTEFELVGHAHPRLAKIAYPFYHKHKIRILKTFDDVLNEADVYITDNSSTLYEFADLDRPVVVLNPPWFRRDIHHGLRFWECADVGVQCERPEDLKEAILKAIEDPQEIADRRREIMCDIYPFKGNSSQLAVQAIEKRWKELFERRGDEVKVRVERPFLHDGRIVKSGEIVDMGNQKAQNLEKKKLVTFIPEIKVPSENKMITPPENKAFDSIEEKDPDGRGYVCQICDRGFYTLSGLKSHIRAAHPGAPYPKD